MGNPANFKSVNKLTNTKLTYLKNTAPLSLALMAFASSQALAQELVEDGGFQIPALADGSDIAESPVWALRDNTRFINPTKAPFADNTLYGNVAEAPAGKTVAQNLKVTLQPNKIYSFSMDIGWSEGTVFSSYLVQFAFYNEDGTSFATVPISMNGVPDKEGEMVKATGSISTAGNYQQVIDSGKNIILELRNSGDPGTTVLFDNVTIKVTDAFSGSDSDKDGMPDSWETQYGFDPFNANDANEDADNDNATNLEEFNARTNPRNGNDFPGEYPYVNKGSTRIEGAMRLLPQTDAPFECNADHTGAMYFDSTLQQTLICDGTSWNEFQGAHGEQGEKGDKGDTGAPGKDGINGAPGKDGEDGAPGKDGKDGLDGEKGEKGEKGETGEQGPPGVSAWVDGNNNVSTSVSVGIGNTTPAAALDVAGNVIANDPTANNHLTTKSYVDTQIASAAAKTCVPTQISSFPETSGDVSVSGSGYVTGLSYVEATNGSRSSLFRGATVTVDGLSGRVNPTITSTWVNAPGDQLLNGLAPMNSRFNTGFSFSADWTINGSQFSETMVVVYYCLEQ